MITRYTLNPFEDLRVLQKEMNRLFSNYGSNEEVYPALNLWTNGNEVLITAEIPGIDTNDLDITVNNNQLIIEGVRKVPDVNDNFIYHRNERGYGKFNRTIRLPFDVDSEKISAKYVNGVLRISLPRTESSKPRKIEIIKE